MLKILPFLLLLSPLACKSTSDPNQDKSYLVNQGDGLRRIYFMDGDLLKTAICAGNLPEINEDSKPERIKALCKDQVSAGVSLKDFREAMVKLFMTTYKTTEMSAYEKDSLDIIIAQITDEQTILEGWEAQKGVSDPYEIDSIWLQFMPFAAGAQVKDRSKGKNLPISGSLVHEQVITLGDSQAEYEFPGAEFANEVNLFNVMATTEDKKSICPAYLDILSITRMENDQAVPVFGGAVVGGSRFLLNEASKKISGLRIDVNPAFNSPDFRPGVRCVLAVFSARVDAMVLGYEVVVPKPLALDARDMKMAELMAKPEVRAWHFLWHGIRNGWQDFSPEEKAEMSVKLGKGWNIDTGGTGDKTQKGEEFMHMHHTMLGALREHLGKDMYEAWSEPPAPTDPKFGMPAYVDPAQRTYIDSQYQRLMEWHKDAINPAILKQMTLSDYGSWIEETLHNTMHNAWAHPGQWYRSYGPTTQEIMSQPGKYPAFNHPSNNSLIGTYSSHVNPLFYRLHGYIDAKLMLWLESNGYKSAQTSCPAGDKTCYQWKRTWTGELPATVNALVKKHAHGVEPQKLGELSEGVFREIARNSEMRPELESPEQLKK